jgi:hypothetical protein
MCAPTARECTLENQNNINKKIKSHQTEFNILHFSNNFGVAAAAVFCMLGKII